MYKNQFKSLLKVQDLEVTIHIHREKIIEHEQRVTDIEKMRQERSSQLDEQEDQLSISKKDLTHLEAELHSTETLLTKSNEDLNIVSNEAQATALQKQINTLTPKRDELEESAFTRLEDIELLEGKIKEHKTFLDGSLGTLSEISSEVKTSVGIELQEIEYLQSDRDEAFNLCDNTVQEVFNSLSKRFKNRHPISQVKERKCMCCKSSITQVSLDSVSSCNQLEYCTACGRLLVP